MVITQVYIDPNFIGISDGTISNPYRAFPIFIKDTVYLLKSDTILTLNNTLIVNADNVIISSYGEGKKPIIYNPISTRRTITITGNNVKLIGICSKMPKAESYDLGEWNIALMNKERKEVELTIDNCDIIGGSPSVHSFLSTASEFIIVQ